jgi:hypothetical protein
MNTRHQLLPIIRRKRRPLIDEPVEVRGERVEVRMQSAPVAPVEDDVTVAVPVPIKKAEGEAA